MSSSKQVAAGIDIGNDGEQQRVGFQTYVPQRMTGFGGISKRRRGREFEEFPELVAISDAPLSARRPKVSRTRRRRRASSNISTLTPIESEIARFKRDRRRAAFAELFMTAASPGIISTHHAQRLLRHRTRPISTPSRAR